MHSGILKLTYSVLAFTSLFVSKAQDSSVYRLRLSATLLDAPQNMRLPYNYPSMNQAFEMGTDFYELGYWGIDGLGDKLFKRKNKRYNAIRRISNGAFKYFAGLGFAYYGSELPLPLGVWTHEEFHRSVLGLGKLASKNGNWIGNRWDGTVYGVSDGQLDQLKTDHPDQLLYSYVAGIQSEIMFNEKVTVNDFYKHRSLYKNSFLLYNAFYTYNYFKFSVSAQSDSVKRIAPKYEDREPEGRDYAGADLTAWAYDMFNADSAFTKREPFPGGNGVNRRIGFSDLSPEAQTFLKREKQLSLLNFINPAIFFVNRIKINQDLSFLFFTQYSPTHFGHDVAYFLPFRYKKMDLLVALHTYKNMSQKSYGLQAGLFNYKLNDLFETDLVLHAWLQPLSYTSSKQDAGGACDLKVRAKISGSFSVFAEVDAKTKGWQLGNPYLKENLSFRFGLNYNLRRI